MGRILIPVPPPWLTVAAVLSLGIGGAAAGQFGLATGDRAVAVIVPPWRPSGMAFAAEVGLPALDIRWGGRVVVFPATDDPLAMARMGPFTLPADGPFGCLPQILDPGV